jgi:gamma-glutamylcyclotransferase (GGCT)/AIG2-like uncharacterized protein YtfP
MNKQLYFAYGSNMDRGQMAHRCPGARKVGIALLNGYRFIINSRGVASVVPDKEHIVKGVVWEISPNDMESLDLYEGVASGLYRKVYMQVVLSETIESELALVYIAKDEVPGKSREGYLDSIISAAKDHGLDEEYIAELKRWG